MTPRTAFGTTHQGERHLPPGQASPAVSSVQCTPRLRLCGF
jgi:hypothetical protein